MTTKFDIYPFVWYTHDLISARSMDQPFEIGQVHWWVKVTCASKQANKQTNVSKMLYTTWIFQASTVYVYTSCNRLITLLCVYIYFIPKSAIYTFPSLDQFVFLWQTVDQVRWLASSARIPSPSQPSLPPLDLTNTPPTFHLLKIKPFSSLLTAPSNLAPVVVVVVRSTVRQIQRKNTFPAKDWERGKHLQLAHPASFPFLQRSRLCFFFFLFSCFSSLLLHFPLSFLFVFFNSIKPTTVIPYHWFNTLSPLLLRPAHIMLTRFTRGTHDWTMLTIVNKNSGLVPSTCSSYAITRFNWTLWKKERI